MMRVIRKNIAPFSAIVVLFILAAAVGAYLLSNQRFQFPLVEDEPMKVYVQLQNAQAVTPGQGQTVQVSGVKIGDIGKVELKDGRARVEMKIEKKYDDLIHPDARAQLRPRTGLKDMYIQIFPGKQGSPVKEGYTIPATNTMTDTNLDEILSTLDSRTRDYLTLLANGAGEGLRGKGNQLARVFQRFEPTFRDLRRVNQAVGTERRALRRLVTSLANVNGEIAKQPRVVSQLVDRAATTFAAFRSEDDNLRSTVSELAPTLQVATATLRDVQPFAQQLGPTTRALIPAVRKLDDANREVQPFAKEATPIIRRQVRPFVRAARPLVRDLRPAAADLRTSLPELRRDLKVVNDFFNMAGNNPGGKQGPGVSGREEGYLFWLAWVAHQGVNLQSIEDAHGAMRPIFLTGTCSTLTSLVNDFPPAEIALGLSPLLEGVCSNPDTRSVDERAALRMLKKQPKEGSE